MEAEIFSPLEKEITCGNHHFLGGGNSNIFGIFTPEIGEDSHFDEHIFQRGGEKPPTSFQVPAVNILGCVFLWPYCPSNFLGMLSLPSFQGFCHAVFVA